MFDLMKTMRLFALAALLVSGGALIYLGAADANESGGAEQRLTLDSNATTMQEFLTGVTQDVDAYWTEQFKAAGLDEPRVKYAWIPAGQTASSACGDDSGQLGADAAAYCPSDDTIYISETFANGVLDGALNQSLPGAAQGYGDAMGDFAVAYIVAHEYGHEIQNELGDYEKYGNQVPTMNFE